jgi:opacity protein-like surface antigen
MKKLIAIAVVFALVAGVAFAADVGAEVIGSIPIIFSDTSDATDGKVFSGGWVGDDGFPGSPGGMRRARVYAGGQNEEGTFGGWFRFETYGPGSPNLHGNAWWKPIDQFKLMIGWNPDGDYSRDGVARWGFYQVGGDTDVIREKWHFGASFYDGWSKNGALLSITPIENLLIFLGVPFSSGGYGTEAGDVFSKMEAQVAYDISGIGNIALTYRGGLGHKDAAGTTAEVNDPGKIFFYFGLSAIENLGIDLGLGYTFPITKEDKTTINAPMAIGLGLKFDAGAFGVKARFQGQLGGSSKPDGGTEWKDPTVIDFDILPYFAVSDTVSVLLSAGLEITAPGDNDYGSAGKPDAVTGWHVEPYITVKSSWWAPNFYAGIRLESDGVKGADDKTVTRWSVPIGMVFSF